jgi:hypothetical protein
LTYTFDSEYAEMSVVEDANHKAYHVPTEWLIPAEPVTTTEELARYDRIEAVVDKAQEAILESGRMGGWFRVPATAHSEYNERAWLFALLEADTDWED